MRQEGLAATEEDRMQDTQEMVDAAVVRAWLQANMPGLDVVAAAQENATQNAVLEGTTLFSILLPLHT